MPAAGVGGRINLTWLHRLRQCFVRKIELLLADERTVDAEQDQKHNKVNL